MRKDFLQFFPCKSIICYLLFFFLSGNNEVDEARARKLQKIEQLKKRPVKRPDWNELMKDIESLRYGKSTRNLKKTITNDRSKPMLSQTKIKGKVSYILFDVGDCVVKNAGHFSQIIGPTSIFSNLEMFSRCFCVFTSVCHKILNNKNLTFFTVVMAMLHFFC